MLIIQLNFVSQCLRATTPEPNPSLLLCPQGITTQWAYSVFKPFCTLHNASCPKYRDSYKIMERDYVCMCGVGSRDKDDCLTYLSMEAGAHYIRQAKHAMPCTANKESQPFLLLAPPLLLVSPNPQHGG